MVSALTTWALGTLLARLARTCTRATIDRAIDRTNDRAIDRTNDQSIDRTNDRTNEILIDRSGERSSERLIDRLNSSDQSIDRLINNIMYGTVQFSRCQLAARGIGIFFLLYIRCENIFFVALLLIIIRSEEGSTRFVFLTESGMFLRMPATDKKSSSVTLIINIFIFFTEIKP